MLDGHFRSSIEKGLKPVGQNLKRTGISPDHLTALGVVMAAVAAVAIGAGNLPLGLFFLVLAAVPDALDGAVAKASGMASPRGAFFDSVADRVSDALLFGGVAWYFAADDRGLLVMVPVAVLATSLIISYERARAESLGYAAKGGVMERAERLILLGLGLLFEVLLVPVLLVMLALTTLTVGQRFVKVWRQASAPRPHPRRSRRTPRPRRSASTSPWRQRRTARRRDR